MKIRRTQDSVYAKTNTSQVQMMAWLKHGYALFIQNGESTGYRIDLSVKVNGRELSLDEVARDYRDEISILLSALRRSQ